MNDSKIKISARVVKQYVNIAKEKHGKQVSICAEQRAWLYDTNNLEETSSIFCTGCHENFNTEKSFLEAHKAHKGGQS